MAEIADETLSVTSLPHMLVYKIYAHLSPREALKTSLLSRRFPRLIQQDVQLAFSDETWQGPYREDFLRFWQELPIPRETWLHSLTINVELSDQCWGHNKGCLYVIERHLPPVNEEDNLELAAPEYDCYNGLQRLNANLRLEIPVKREQSYQEKSCVFGNHLEERAKLSLWYKVGGGGGHELSVTNITVSLLGAER
mmetsp:Transcript_3942/g.6931  ORF Transcript_3942/g.6931 Transcript_3942/m.6931 type:complete len:196 (-) Transcript_3942:72-659(-)